MLVAERHVHAARASDSHASPVVSDLMFCRIQSELSLRAQIVCTPIQTPGLTFSAVGGLVRMMVNRGFVKRAPLTNPLLTLLVATSPSGMQTTLSGESSEERFFVLDVRCVVDSG